MTPLSHISLSDRISFEINENTSAVHTEFKRLLKTVFMLLDRNAKGDFFAIMCATEMN